MADRVVGDRAGHSSRRPGSRIGNVAGALLWGGCSAPSRTARLLDALFEEVLLVGGVPEVGTPGRQVADSCGSDHALRALVAALAATDAERVVFVATDGPFLTVDLLLALTAWPEADAVVPTELGGAPPPCAIYRREDCLEQGRVQLAAGGQTLHDLLESVETTRVSLVQLGITEAGVDLLTNPDRPGDRTGLESR